MKTTLCCLILCCLGLYSLARPPKQNTEDLYYKKQMALLRDTGTYRLYLDELISRSGFCQTTDTASVYIASETDDGPEWLTGSNGMLKFLVSNVKYPALAREYGIEGKVIAKFLIDENGTLCNPVILRYAGFGLDEETIRVLKLMQQQKWQPALKNGNPVKAYYYLPITFKLA